MAKNEDDFLVLIYVWKKNDNIFVSLLSTEWFHYIVKIYNQITIDKVNYYNYNIVQSVGIRVLKFLWVNTSCGIQYSLYFIQKLHEPSLHLDNIMV